MRKHRRLIFAFLFALVFVGAIIMISRQAADRSTPFARKEAETRSTRTVGNKEIDVSKVAIYQFFNQEGFPTLVDRVWLDGVAWAAETVDAVTLEKSRAAKEIRTEKGGITFQYVVSKNNGVCKLLAPDVVKVDCVFHGYPRDASLELDLSSTYRDPMGRNKLVIPSTYIKRDEFVVNGDETTHRIASPASLLNMQLSVHNNGVIETETRQELIDISTGRIEFHYREKPKIMVDINELTQTNTLKPFNDELVLIDEKNSSERRLQGVNGRFTQDALFPGVYALKTNRKHIFIEKEIVNKRLSYKGASTLWRVIAPEFNHSWIALPLTEIVVHNRYASKLRLMLELLSSEYVDTIKKCNPGFPLNSSETIRYVFEIVESEGVLSDRFLIPGRYSYDVARVEELSEFNKKGKPKKKFTSIVSGYQDIPYSETPFGIELNFEDYGGIEGNIDSDLLDGHSVYLIDYNDYKNQNFAIEQSNRVKGTTFKFELIEEGKYVVGLETGINHRDYSEPIQVKAGETSHVSFIGYQKDISPIQFQIVDRFSLPIRRHNVTVESQSLALHYSSDDEGNVNAGMLSDASGVITICIQAKQGFINTNYGKTDVSSQTIDQSIVQFEKLGRLTFKIEDGGGKTIAMPVVIQEKSNYFTSSLIVNTTDSSLTEVDAFPIGSLEFYDYDVNPPLLIGREQFVSPEPIVLHVPKTDRKIFFVNQDKQPVKGVNVVALRNERYYRSQPSFEDFIHSIQERYLSNVNGEVELTNSNDCVFLFYHPNYGLGVLETPALDVNEPFVKYLNPKTSLNIEPSEDCLFTYFILSFDGKNTIVMNVKENTSLPIQPGIWCYKIENTDQTYEDLIKTTDLQKDIILQDIQ